MRKGWKVPVDAVPDVLRIHSAVNERSWNEVRRGERITRNNPDPKLQRFVGRPKDTSPKAWFNSNILMYKPPFDRHDWYIQDNDANADAEPRRYVIDFYEGNPDKGHFAGGGGKDGDDGVDLPPRPPSMFVDVRPALDTPSAAMDRAAMFFRDVFPGIAGAWDAATR